MLDCNICYYLGLYILIWACVRPVKSLIAFFLHRRKPTDLGQRYGRNSFVLVTGASDGIGRAYCEFFAKQGLNLLMVARNKEKMEGVKNAILKTSPRADIRFIIKDFTEALKPGFFDEFEKAKADFDVSVVVNNVGILGHPDNTADYVMDRLPLKCVKDVVAVNLTAQAALHRIFTPAFLARKHQSAFIDVSSEGSNYHPLGWENYGATKDFNRYLTNSLANGSRTGTIDYLSHVSGKVDTNIFATTGLKMPGGITPAVAVEEVCKSLGLFVDTNGHWKHGVTNTIMSIIFEKYDIYFRPLLNYLLRTYAYY